MAESEFDRYAEQYDAALAHGLAWTGEGREYFAARRAAWLHKRLSEIGHRPERIMDYGCGDGATLPILQHAFLPETLVGFDLSASSVDCARRRGDGKWVVDDVIQPAWRNAFDLVYCNGVLHHVPTDSRQSTLREMASLLRVGGILAVWENNPWNPGTRWVMSRIPFDRDAIPLSAGEVARLCETEGLEVIRKDHIFVFPRSLGFLRCLEPGLSQLPIGGQSLTLSRA